MVYRLVLGLLIAVGSFGQITAFAQQQQNSVYKTLFTNVVAATTSSNVLNIGQVGHQVLVIYTEVSSGTCTTSQGVVTLEGSYDNTTFIPFGQGAPSGDSTGIKQLYIGNGLYPYVRVHLISLKSGCKATGYYTGSLQSTPLVTTCNSSDGGGLYTSTSGDNVVIVNSSATTSIKICGILINTNSTTNATVQLFQTPYVNGDVPGSVCTGRVLPNMTGVLQLTTTNPTISWGGGTGYIMQLGQGNNLCITGTGVAVDKVLTTVVSYVIN